MKLLYTLMLFVFVTVFAQAQNFAPVGAKWVYSTNRDNVGTIHFLEVKSEADTVINGVNCQRIMADWSCMMSGEINVHSSADSVYVYDAVLDTFSLLYAFDAVAGDSWTFLYADNDSLTDTLTVSIDSNWTEQINGVSLKAQRARWESTSYPFLQTYTIKEKLGNVYYLFNLYNLGYASCDGRYPNKLRCYSDPNFGAYETGLVDSCYQIIPYNSVEEINAENAINVWPNPAHEVLNVELVEGVEALRLINSNGQEVLVQQVSKSTSTQTLQLNLSALPAGVYQLVGTSNQKVLVRTVVKD